MQVPHQLLCCEEATIPTDCRAPLTDVFRGFVETSGDATSSLSACEVNKINIFNWTDDVMSTANISTNFH